MKIQSKILAIIFIVVLLTGGVSTLIVRSISMNIVEDEISDHLITTAQSRAHHIQTMLESQRQTVETVASAADLYLTLIMEGFSGMTRDSTLPLTGSLLDGMAMANSGVREIFYIYKDGIVEYASNPEFSGFDASQTEFFVMGKEAFSCGGKGVLVGDTLFGTVDGIPSLAVVSPVQVGEDFDGIMALLFSEEDLFKITADITGLGKTGEVYIVNEDGYMITESRFRDNAVMQQKIDLSNIDESAENPGSLDTDWKVVSTTNYMGEKVLRVAHQMPEVEWTIVVEKGFSEAFAPVSRLTQIMLWSLLAVLLLGALLSLVVSRAISKPIISLHRGAEAIMNGNWESDVATSAKDEIGELSRAFSKMTANLKRSHKELQLYSESLETKVEERTFEIERLLNQKESFITQLGHDLRSPLTPLVALTPLIRDQQTDPKSREVLDVIVMNVRYMKDLVEKVMKLAKLNSTDEMLDIDNVKLASVPEGLIKSKQEIIVQSNITVENRIDKDITVAADRLRLVEVFDNLIMNAIKFMPGGGSLIFDARVNEKFVAVAVKDTGIGLTDNQVRYIFDEFYKADQSRHNLDSSGLGLAICKRILEKHGGRMWANSDGPGQGATFYFTVPLNIGIASE